MRHFSFNKFLSNSKIMTSTRRYNELPIDKKKKLSITCEKDPPVEIWLLNTVFIPQQFPTSIIIKPNYFNYGNRIVTQIAWELQGTRTMKKSTVQCGSSLNDVARWTSQSLVRLYKAKRKHLQMQSGTLNSKQATGGSRRSGRGIASSGRRYPGRQRQSIHKRWNAGRQGSQRCAKGIN